MKMNAKRLLIGSGIAAAGAAAAGAGHRSLSRFFVDVAIDRNAPRHSKRAHRLLTRSVLDPEIQQAIKTAAAQLEQVPMETVHTVSRDGLRLVGHWYENPQARRVIVAMHGWRSSWSHDFSLVYDFMRESGCSILFAEQRAHGSSEGEYLGFGLLERYDCLGWVQWVQSRTALPIYLSGISMGASTVLMAAGLELPESVKGIIADCGYTSPAAIWKHVATNNLHLSYRMYRAAVNDLCKQRIQCTGEEYSCVDAMKVCKVPVLFIHGTDDHFVPVEMSYENYKACAAPKRLFIVPGAEHGMSYCVDRDGYQAELNKFWQDNDA